MVTIRDVAKHAEVACSTVSHVFNGTATISEETRLRVLQAAETLGYIPKTFRNPRRSLARRVIMFKRVGRTNMAELEAGSEDFADPIMASAFKTLKSHGYGVWMLPHSDDEMDACIRSINMTEFSGALVVDNVYESFSNFPALALPTVLAYCETQSNDCLSVVPDDFGGAFDATKHLIDLGHRRIAFLNGPADWFACQARYQGYMAALNAFDIPVVTGLVSTTSWAVENGRASMLSILQQQDVTAVFAANDLLAIGAVQALRSQGLRVPEDTAVVGFDNRLFAQFVDPPLTTMNLPLNAIGERAALELIHIMQTTPHHHNQVSRIQIHCPLVIRQSCGYALSQKRIAAQSHPNSS